MFVNFAKVAFREAKRLKEEHELMAIVSNVSKVHRGYVLYLISCFNAV